MSIHAQGDQLDLLVNVIDKYKGTVLFDESDGEQRGLQGRVVWLLDDCDQARDKCPEVECQNATQGLRGSASM